MSDLISDSQNKKRGLGRGLGSLLSPGNVPQQAPTNIRTEAPKAFPAPTASPVATPVVSATPTTKEEVSTENKVWQVAIEKLKSGSTQPREVFNKASLEELAQSIKSNGILQPIVARRTTAGGPFEIIAGERRWRAAQIAGLHEVPVIIRNLADQPSLELAIIENIQREDLNPIEEAKAYQRLALEFNLSHQAISEKVGKERATVTNSLRVLSLPNKVQDMISMGNLSLGHAKVLLGLQDLDLIIKTAEDVVKNPISVRQLESKIKALNTKEDAPSSVDSKAEIRETLVRGLEEDLQKAVGRKVEIKYKNGKGSVSLSFYSDDELTEILENTKKGWLARR